MISGFTIARNVISRGYYFEESVLSMLPVCDEVVVLVDPTSDDGTCEAARGMEKNDQRIRVIESVWDMSNIKEGSELAIQTNKALDACRGEWGLYLQADEVLHEKDGAELREIILSERALEYRLLRVDFWGNGETITDMVLLPRAFRNDGQHRSVGDAMHIEPCLRTENLSDTWIYHYAKVAEAEVVSRKKVQLDRFYHTEDEISEEMDYYDKPFDFSEPIGQLRCERR